ncbi:MAG: NAD-dependent epimerase/dehydratase family protein [Chloroflexales bacterium]|nr:NAD-dependent epimerase/dehydratase family protein [Chloroflexales bacterium]
MTRVFINGIDGLLGAKIAQLLSADPDVTIIGLGRKTPPAPIGRAEYLTAKLTGRQIRDLLRAERVDVVIHLAFAGAESRVSSREEAVQQNVLGSMELLGACAGAGVARVLVRSHTAVYGASPLNPTFIAESRPVARSNAPGVVRDFVEVEQFIAEFATQHPGLSIMPIRCASMIGGWAPFVDYLTQDEPRMLVGFDPCVQLLHLDDAVSGFALAALSHASGAFNLAADDTLCLSQAIKLAGRQPAPVFEPIVNLAISLGNRDMLGLWPFDISFLRHSCVADTTRARCELGWTPTYTALDALQHLSANGQVAESRETPEEALRAFLARRS